MGLVNVLYTSKGSSVSSDNPVFTGSMSINRKAGSVIGNCSVAEGNDSIASGSSSHAEGYSNIASGVSSHTEGSFNRASGDYAHAEGANVTTTNGTTFDPVANEVYAASGHVSHKEGINTIAKGMGSHAEGIVGTINTTSDGVVISITELDANKLLTIGALGVASHAEGISTIASGSCSHAEGLNTMADGSCSHAEGYNTTASRYASHAEGGNTVVEGNYSHAEGYKTKASGSSSHAEGNGTTASGGNSHAEGYYTIASGSYSHAEGNQTIASGSCSHAGGQNSTTSTRSSFAHGHFVEIPSNLTGLGHAVFGAYNNTNTMDPKTLFTVGGGTETTKINAFRIVEAGTVYAAGSYNTGGADFAEIYEWEDANIDNEDRRGLFVTNNIEKIVIAQPGDYILGAISSTPCLVGNSSEDWNDRWIKDIFGNIITEEVEIDIMGMVDKEIITEDTIVSETILDKDGNETTVEKIIPGKAEIIKEYEPTGETKMETRNKQNPDYNPDQIYVGRADRKEWDYVGLHGQIIMIDDGTCEVNGFCKPSVGGIATKANTHNGYRVLNRLDDTHIKIQMESIRIFD